LFLIHFRVNTPVENCNARFCFSFEFRLNRSYWKGGIVNCSFLQRTAVHEQIQTKKE
jgi:hypothetical protein